MGKDQGKSEVIRHNGIAFRRYPASVNWADQMYYTPNASHKKSGVGRLHEELWKDANGPIPSGHHIHHKDGNPLNNDLNNLQCLTAAAHQELHGAQRRGKPGNPYTVAKMQEAARVWHKSDEGRVWHSQVSKAAWVNKPVRGYVCDHCGKAYESRDANPVHTRFCSNACKTASRLRSGVDNEQRTCKQCGTLFSCNRYANKQFCSSVCKGKDRQRKEERSCLHCGTTFTVYPSHTKRFCGLPCAYAHRRSAI